MRKLIQMLCNVNKKTDNEFFVALGIVLGLIIATIFTYNGMIALPVDDKEIRDGIGFYFLLFFMNTILMLIWSAIIGAIGAAIYGIWSWMKDTILPAFKEAAEEDYDIKPRDRAKVEFN